MSKIMNIQHIDPELDIAIIGMAGRFPGAKNLEEYWKLLSQGKESVTFFSDKELKESGVNPSTYNDPSFVKAAPILEDADKFDASFFGYSPRDAKIMDPQQRLFLELAFSALEDGGYDPDKYKKPISVFGGIAMNTYFLFSGFTSNFVTEYIPTLLGNDKDFLSTKVSYKLNLKGPSLTVQSACSTSLVAIHLACQSLLSEECGMALAGATAIRVPLKTGHYYQENGILTKDGHCRPFDANATGTIFGSGGGVILLKKLKNALEDNDNIYALIKGSAINNDGRTKVDYTAPSVDAQAHVIIEAQANAGIKADQIQYVEAHGTGTFLGDPIEIAALTKAFRTTTENKGFCAVGSVKSNIGHLDAAAGIAGLIKTVLSLKNKKIPPSINFDSPNPEIDFENSPFFVNSVLSSWKKEDIPLRAGISSLGIGGTNAHIVLEEAPKLIPSVKPESDEILFLSARSDCALNEMTSNLAEYLKNNPEENLSDIAYTLREGRKIFDKKRIIVSDGSKQVVDLLQSEEADQIQDFELENRDRDVVFLFPGGGAQYINMGRDLYNSELIFRNEVDKCLKITNELVKIDLKEILFPEENQEEFATTQMTKPTIGLTSLFIIEYAMAKYLMSIGIKPTAMIGHSLGEYSAACISGVLKLEDALYMVTKRSELFQKLPSGAMLSVLLSELEVQKYLSDELSIAVINSPSICVVSGPISAVEQMEKLLASDNIEYRRLKISVASHSKMVEPILNEFYESIKEIKFEKSSIPFASNMSGKLIKNLEVSNPNYWVDHIRNTVRFADGIKLLLEQPHRILLEVGPGTTLTTITRQSPSKQKEQLIISSMRHPLVEVSDNTILLKSIGQLHFAGIKLDWDAINPNESYKRISLPTYPFEKQRHWVDYSGTDGKLSSLSSLRTSFSGKLDPSQWFYLPSWKPSMMSGDNKNQKNKNNYVVFVDDLGFGDQLAEQLKKQQDNVVIIKIGEEFKKIDKNIYSINPRMEDDYYKLFSDLDNDVNASYDIVHLWNLTLEDYEMGIEFFKRVQYNGFYSIIYIGKALRNQNRKDKIKLTIISNNLHNVNSEEKIIPAKTTILSPAMVIPQENVNVFCSSIDIHIDNLNSWKMTRLVDNLIAEIKVNHTDVFIAFRGNQKYTQSFEQVNISSSSNLNNSNNYRGKIKLRNKGVYLITGGLGDIGLIISEYLAQKVQAKLVLISRTLFPPKAEWENWLATHDSANKISKKISKIQQIEKIGSEVMIESADVSDYNQMTELIRKIDEKFGQTQGIIHGAGYVAEGAFSYVEELTEDHCEQHFKSKVYGALILEEIFRSKNLDFILTTSSLAAILGGLGHTAYSAANLFLDAFGYYCYQMNDTPWIGINWDVWWLADTFETMSKLGGGNTMSTYGITLEEGYKALDLIFSADFMNQVIISTGSLSSRISQWVNLDSLKKSEEDSIKTVQVDSSGITFKDNYLAPRNEVERMTSEAWQESLGIDRIGIRDNFYELGGHSLMATQLISRLRGIFQLDLSLKDILSNPTVAELAKKIEEKIAEVTENNDSEIVGGII